MLPIVPPGRPPDNRFKILRLPQPALRPAPIECSFELKAESLALLQEKGLRNPFAIFPSIKNRVEKLFAQYQPQTELDKAIILFRSVLPYNHRSVIEGNPYFGIRSSTKEIRSVISSVTQQQEIFSPEEILGVPFREENASDFETHILLLTQLRAAGIKASLKIDEKNYASIVTVQLANEQIYLLEAKAEEFKKGEKSEVELREDEPVVAWFYYLKGQVAFQQYEDKRKVKDPTAATTGDSALSYLEAALSLKTNLFGAWFCRGATLRYQGREEEAKNSFAIGQYYEAMQYLTLGEQETSTALEHLEEALKLNPHFVEAWFETGKLLYRMRRQMEARLSFDKAIKYLKAEASDQNKDQIAESYFYRGLAIQQLALLVDPELTEEYSRATEALQRAAISLNDPDLIFNPPFGRFDNFDHRMLEEVGLSFDEALKLKPDYPEAWVEKGKILLELNQGKEAIDSLLHAVRLQKNNTAAWFLLGFAYLEYGAEKLSPKKLLSVAATCFARAFAPERENSDQSRNLLIMAVNFARLRRRSEALLCLDIISRYGGQEFATRAWMIRALILKDKKTK